MSKPKFKLNAELRWSNKTKLVALLISLLVCVLGYVGLRQSEEYFLGYLQYVLPLIMAAFSFGMCGLILNHHAKIEALKALPGIEYSFKEAYILWITYIYLWLVSLSYFFTRIFDIIPGYRRILGSWPHMLLFVAALCLVSGAGSQLIPTMKNQTILYRDAVSASRLSRQDIFFTLCGSWQDGIIIGWKRFPYEQMGKFYQDDKNFMLTGKEAGGTYSLLVYTPRLQGFLSEKLGGRFPEA